MSEGEDSASHLGFSAYWWLTEGLQTTHTHTHSPVVRDGQAYWQLTEAAAHVCGKEPHHLPVTMVRHIGG